MHHEWLQLLLVIVALTLATAVKRQGHIRPHEMLQKPDETPSGLVRRVHHLDEHPAAPQYHPGGDKRVWFQEGLVTSGGDIKPWVPPLATRVPQGNSHQQASAPTSVVIMGSGSIHPTDQDTLLDQGLMRRQAGAADSTVTTDPTAGTITVAPTVAPLIAAAAPVAGVAPVSGAVTAAPATIGAAPVVGAGAPVVTAAPAVGAPATAGVPAATGAPVATGAPTATGAPAAAVAPATAAAETGGGIGILVSALIFLILGVIVALAYAMLRRSRARQSDGGRLLASNSLEGSISKDWKGKEDPVWKSANSPQGPSPRRAYTRSASGLSRGALPVARTGSGLSQGTLDSSNENLSQDDKAQSKENTRHTVSGSSSKSSSYRARRGVRPSTWDGSKSSPVLGLSPAAPSDQSESDSKFNPEDNEAEKTARKVTKETLSNAAVTGKLQSALTTFAGTAQADIPPSPVSSPKRTLSRQGSGGERTKPRGVRIVQEANVKVDGSRGLHDTRTDSRSLGNDNMEV